VKTILIIDDDHEIRESLRELFEIEGYGVLTACDGQEGWEMLSRVHVPDLVLLDQNMPVWNGADFLKRKKHHERLASVPVLLMSAQARFIRDPDVSDFVSKPFHVPELLETMRKYVGSKQLA
jgi:CheY-like chemotaxis protein